jgi:hypothetical protein
MRVIAWIHLESGNQARRVAEVVATNGLSLAVFATRTLAAAVATKFIFLCSNVQFVNSFILLATGSGGGYIFFILFFYLSIFCDCSCLILCTCCFIVVNVTFVLFYYFKQDQQSGFSCLLSICFLIKNFIRHAQLPPSVDGNWRLEHTTEDSNGWDFFTYFGKGNYHAHDSLLAIDSGDILSHLKTWGSEERSAALKPRAEY